MQKKQIVNMNQPLISIMLCSYNSAQFIKDAINSVLAQSFTDFEFIIVNDGSTDNTLDIMRSYTDSRIKIINCSHNYINSLNKGMQACRGKFIARMDADDKIAYNRLEYQIRVMQENPEITVCFSWGQTFGEFEEPIGHCARGKVENPYFWFVTGNYLMHPSAMIRKSFLKKHHIQYKDYPYAEDYKLWTDITRLGGTFYIIPQQLLFYRVGNSQVSVKFREIQNNTRLLIQQRL